MNVPDPLSLFISTFALADLGCRYRSAHEEIKVYKEIVRQTSDLISAIRDKLEKSVAGHPHIEKKEWISRTVQEAEALLMKANKVTKGMDKLVPQKRLRWILKKRGVAESYKGAIFQSHMTLLHISTLLELQGQRHEFPMPLTAADTHSRPKQITDSSWEGRAVDDSHWSGPPRRTLTMHAGSHSFHAPYAGRRISRAAITGRAMVRHRRANTDLHAYLLDHVLQNSR